MNKIVVSIVALLVAVVVFTASLPIFASVSMETVSAENEGGGELRYILVDSHRQFSISLDEENGVLTVTNGTDKQTITESDNFLYADSNFSILVTSDTIYLFGTGSDSQIVSTNLDIPVTVARVDGGVSVTDGVNTYSFGTPAYAYVPLSTGGYASYPNGSEVTLDSSVKDAFIGGYANTTAYNGMNTGNYNLVLQKDQDGNVLSGGQWVAGSDTPDNPDLLNLIPLDIDPLDIDPVPLGPLNPGAQLMAVPTPTYTDGDWGYDLSNGDATIVSYSGSAGNITIPATVGGYPVVAVGKGGANQNVFDTSLSDYTVIISSGITNINNNAFKGCTGLTSVTIPASVTTIGSTVFYGCTGLTSLTVDELNLNYSSSGNVLYNKDQTDLIACSPGLTSLTMPASVTTIKSYSVSGCTGLTSVTLSDSIIIIESGAFSGCTGLTSVTIPGSVETIGIGVFNGCTGLTSVTLSDGLITISQEMFNGCTGLTSVTIPGSVETMGNKCFQNCTGLTSVTFSDGVKSVNGFRNCTGLTSVTIPGSVETIYSFEGCSNLSTVILNEGLKTISSYCFMDCTSLKSITIPSSVITIGAYISGFTPSIEYILNLSEIDISTIQGLGNAEVKDNIPVYLFIANTGYVHIEPKEGAVNTLLSQLPLIAVLGLILGAIAVLVIRRV